MRFIWRNTVVGHYFHARFADGIADILLLSLSDSRARDCHLCRRHIRRPPERRQRYTGYFHHHTARATRFSFARGYIIEASPHGHAANRRCQVLYLKPTDNSHHSFLDVAYHIAADGL